MALALGSCPVKPKVDFSACLPLTFNVMKLKLCVREIPDPRHSSDATASSRFPLHVVIVFIVIASSARIFNHFQQSGALRCEGEPLLFPSFLQQIEALC
jgi:hypothetical protein